MTCLALERNHSMGPQATTLETVGPVQIGVRRGPDALKQVCLPSLIGFPSGWFPLVRVLQPDEATTNVLRVAAMLLCSRLCLVGRRVSEQIIKTRHASQRDAWRAVSDLHMEGAEASGRRLRPVRHVAATGQQTLDRNVQIRGPTPDRWRGIGLLTSRYGDRHISGWPCCADSYRREDGGHATTGRYRPPPPVKPPLADARLPLPARSMRS